MTLIHRLHIITEIYTDLYQQQDEFINNPIIKKKNYDDCIKECDKIIEIDENYNENAYGLKASAQAKLFLF